jgi:hypothetical protein
MAFRTKSLRVNAVMRYGVFPLEMEDLMKAILLAALLLVLESGT